MQRTEESQAKRALSMRKVGTAYRKISAVMGVPEKQVRAIVHREGRWSNWYPEGYSEPPDPRYVHRDMVRKGLKASAAPNRVVGARPAARRGRKGGGEFYTVGQIAKAIDQPEHVVFSAIHSGNIPYIKLGAAIRVHKSEALRFIHAYKNIWEDKAQQQLAGQRRSRHIWDKLRTPAADQESPEPASSQEPQAPQEPQEPQETPQASLEPGSGPDAMGRFSEVVGLLGATNPSLARYAYDVGNFASKGLRYLAAYEEYTDYLEGTWPVLVEDERMKGLRDAASKALLELAVAGSTLLADPK